MIPLQITLEELSYLIQDSSSSRSLKNWCRRWDSLSLARRPAAMLLILVKRPLTASRLSFTCEVSKALLAIRLSAWPFRSFRRSCGQDTNVQTLGFSWVHQNVSKSLLSKSLMPVFSKIQLTYIHNSMQYKATTSWAEMSASSSWCFFSKLFTEARSLP